MPKPELGPVAVGDRLLVVIPKYNNPYPEPVKADVTKVGRIWIEMEETEQTRSFKRKWRLRLDTQDTGSSNGRYGDRFVTVEQHAWEEQLRRVSEALFDAGISLRNSSPWRDDERKLALAEFIRTYDEQHP